jgi:hypothetical protein
MVFFIGKNIPNKDRVYIGWGILYKKIIRGKLYDKKLQEKEK